MTNDTRAIIITEPKDYSEAALARYRALGPVYFYSELNGQEKSRVEQEAAALVVGINFQINKAFLDALPRLEAVGTPTTGLNHIDLHEAKRRGIAVLSLRGQRRFMQKIRATAEEAMALMLALVRNVPWAFDHVKAGYWDRLRWRGRELDGKTLGILGFGRLGSIVARYGRAFGMKAIASDPHVSHAAMARRGVEKVGMDDLFRRADVLSVHVLLTDDVYNLVEARHLKLMKPTAYFINTARAELIEKGALHEALANGWIAGAAVDVLWDERGDGSHLKGEPLIEYAKTYENLLVMPHVGGATFESMAKTQEFIADRVVRFFDKKRRTA